MLQLLENSILNNYIKQGYRKLEYRQGDLYVVENINILEDEQPLLSSTKKVKNYLNSRDYYDFQYKSGWLKVSLNCPAEKVITYKIALEKLFGIAEIDVTLSKSYLLVAQLVRDIDFNMMSKKDLQIGMNSLIQAVKNATGMEVTEGDDRVFIKDKQGSIMIIERATTKVLVNIKKNAMTGVLK